MRLRFFGKEWTVVVVTYPHCEWPGCHRYLYDGCKACSLDKSVHKLLCSKHAALQLWRRGMPKHRDDLLSLELYK